MSPIDLNYYEYLYISLIDPFHYLGVNFDSFVSLQTSYIMLTKTNNNNLVIVHTIKNISITICKLFTIIY